MTTINLIGWTHVHTWNESHGDHSDDIYQRNIDPKHWQRRVENLIVTRYHRDPSQPSHVRVETGPRANDYLRAKEIRANANGQYSPVGPKNITPCYTAGHEDFRDEFTGKHFRIFGAAGHGEWAFELTEEDLKTS